MLYLIMAGFVARLFRVRYRHHFVAGHGVGSRASRGLHIRQSSKAAECGQDRQPVADHEARQSLPLPTRAVEPDAGMHVAGDDIPVRAFLYIRTCGRLNATA